MFAAVSDHVFIDGGHTIDFTNKAFEALDLLGPAAAGQVLPTLVRADRGRAALGGVLGVAPSARPGAARGRDGGAVAASGSGGILGRRCRGDRVAVARGGAARGRRCTDRRARSRARRTRRSDARWRTPPRCASCASTRATITPTGTRCTTRSPRPTRCTRRCGAIPHRSCGAPRCRPRCASTSIAS